MTIKVTATIEMELYGMESHEEAIEDFKSHMKEDSFWPVNILSIKTEEEDA